jgi:hypothetical protein
MPIQVDSSKPRRTVDTSGKLLTTDTNAAAPVKSVDGNGRLYESLDTKKLESAPVPGSNPEAKPNEEKKNEVKNPEAESRKLFLEAQKAERRAKEMEKKAKSGLTKAEAIEKAIKMTESGGDPTAVLTAAGLDPVKFYKDMTSHVLKNPEKPEDPIQKELRETREKLEEYAKANEVMVKTQQDKEELEQHNKIISSTVIPLLQAEPEKYEALLTEYGPNAAVEVYKAVWQRYQETGETVSFQQAAEKMEEYWSQQIETGINTALKMKKFANRFAQSNSTPSQTNTVSQKETPKSNTFTLSNQQKVVSPPTSKLPGNLTWDERAEAIKRKYGA